MVWIGHTVWPPRSSFYSPKQRESLPNPLPLAFILLPLKRKQHCRWLDFPSRETALYHLGVPSSAQNGKRRCCTLAYFCSSGRLGTKSHISMCWLLSLCFSFPLLCGMHQNLSGGRVYCIRSFAPAVVLLGIVPFLHTISGRKNTSVEKTMACPHHSHDILLIEFIWGLSAPWAPKLHFDETKATYILHTICSGVLQFFHLCTQAVFRPW